MIVLYINCYLNERFESQPGRAEESILGNSKKRFKTAPEYNV